MGTNPRTIAAPVDLQVRSILRGALSTSAVCWVMALAEIGITRYKKTCFRLGKPHIPRTQGYFPGR
jgi:hypothetical protein